MWLGAAYALTLLTGALYCVRDTVPPRWDAAGHLLNALVYRDILLAGHWRAFLWRHYAYYPPLVYQMTGALHALLGPGRWVGWLVLEAFALVLMIATYRLGRGCGGSRPAAGLAAVSALLLPLVTVFTREFALDVPLLAVSTAFFVLVLEDPLRSRPRALTLGATMGVGLLTKWTFAIAAAVPLGYALVSALRRRGERRALLLRFALALGVAFALAGPWYCAHFGRLWRDTLLNAVDVARAEGDPTFPSAGFFFYYVRIAVDEWFFVPMALAVMAGLGVALVRRDRAFQLLAVVVAPAFLLFTLVPNKDPRYPLPLVSALCVVVAAAVLGPAAQRWRWLGAVALVTLLGVQHVGSVARLGLASARVNVCLPEMRLRLYDPADPPVYFQLRGAPSGSCRSEWTLYNPYSYFGRRPRREDWQTARIVAAVPDGARSWLAPLDDVHFNLTLAQYLARRDGRRIVWVATPGEADVWLWKGPAAPAELAGLVAPDCPRFDLPDGSRVTVCRRQGR